MIAPNWIAVDWGTTNLRAFAINEDGDVVAEAHSNSGMASLEPSQFEAALLDVIDPWLSADRTMAVYTCGMVGARQGWKEADYRQVPCSPICASEFTKPETTDQRISVRILPGLCQTNGADVMRGEETQIAGLKTLFPEFQGNVCLPGTHSKWVKLDGDKVKFFQTFMTGELYALLADQSVLKHSLTDVESDMNVFLETALSVLDDPMMVQKELFGIRAGSLLSNTKPSHSRARLSGLLIGQELALAKSYWQNDDVMLIGSHELANLYQAVLETKNVKVQNLSADKASFEGLKLIASKELNS